MESIMYREIRVCQPAYSCPACNKAGLHAIYRGQHVQFYHCMDTTLCRARFLASEVFSFGQRLGLDVPVMLPTSAGTFAAQIPESSPDYDRATVLIPGWSDRAA
jgi:hypothetical protein